MIASGDYLHSGFIFDSTFETTFGYAISTFASTNLFLSASLRKIAGM